jgi:hypothetical protein
MNTIVDNRAKTIAGGVNCASSLAAPNNIIARNFTAGTAILPTSNTGTSTCNFSASMLATDLELFAFLMPEGPGPWDYHVTAGSTAIDRGVESDVTFDVDGDHRPQGTNVDVGADEFKQ